ncbi:Quinol monooxygenase YgiN [Cribrihabitans marinus]|jgi:quinol monooxygenase YgiN|uniref:Quinol monooxygenase YgiN n=1 Tax=Cribrihabitans marinus TaxID=1227549 RepID=A0A1H7E1K0_9RHOB|nr:putative quinol monooxygenase [Cribrihabitans marinus]GGH17822.1 antibiotic biosynthesis monooxygenase [Cribrihabitans marinus]SEK06937.1 Quinol monooxygenase YgiN [Cribrihabitans marinus]
MLIVTGTIELDEDSVAPAREAARVMMEETRREDGCLTYEFAQVIGTETRFRIYEEWRDRAALEAHFATPHMATFRAALAGLNVVSRRLVTISDGRIEPL